MMKSAAIIAIVLNLFVGIYSWEKIERDAVKKSPLPLVYLGNQYYYFVIYFLANYFKASQFCRDHGMDLLSIETKAENDYILKYLKDNLFELDHFWTSGSDLGEEGKFVWMAFGKAFNYTYFSTSQPDIYNKIEHCLEIWKFGNENYWNDTNCQLKFFSSAR